MIHTNASHKVLENLPLRPNYNFKFKNEFVIPVPQHTDLKDILYTNQSGRQIDCELNGIRYVLLLSKNGYPLKFNTTIVDFKLYILREMNSFELNNRKKVLFYICQAIHKSNYGS